MKKLGKRIDTVEMTIEAFACTCSSQACWCQYYCDCVSNPVIAVVSYASRSSSEGATLHSAGDMSGSK